MGNFFFWPLKKKGNYQMKRNSVELANKTKLSTLGSNIFLSPMFFPFLYFFLFQRAPLLLFSLSLFFVFLSLVRLINGYFYLLCPNANWPSAVDWLWSSFNAISVKTLWSGSVKKNFAKLAKKTLVSTFGSTFSSPYFHLSCPTYPNNVAGIFNLF